jgi:hypothetical protein
MILASRFSWPHPSWQSKTSSEYDEWLEKRFRLFEKYTLRSVANCYVKPNAWVILINENQKEVSNRLKKLTAVAGCKCIIAPYQGISLGSTVVRACDDIKFPSSIITTNLDTDDVISSDYFAVLRSLHLSSSSTTGISFCSGANYVLSENRYYHSSYPNNPFLSLYEFSRSASDALTIFFKMHTELLDNARYNIFPRSYYPMWASVIHDDNLANRSLLETNRVSFAETEELHRRFGIDMEF